MDEQRERQPAADTFREIPEHVRKWLNGLEPEDIQNFRELRDFELRDLKEFLRWFRTSGRYARQLTLFLMGAFGLYTSIIYLWGQWTGKK